jgi:hypothetical protein
MTVELYPATDIAHGSPKKPDLKWTLHLRIKDFKQGGCGVQLRGSARNLLDVYADLADPVTLEVGAGLDYLARTMGTTSKITVLNAQDLLHRFGVGDLQRGHRGRPRRSGRGTAQVTKFKFRLDRAWGPGCGSELTPRGEFIPIRKGTVRPRDEKGQYAHKPSSNEFEKVPFSPSPANEFEKVLSSTRGKELRGLELGATASKSSKRLEVELEVEPQPAARARGPDDDWPLCQHQRRHCPDCMPVWTEEAYVPCPPHQQQYCSDCHLIGYEA